MHFVKVIESQRKIKLNNNNNNNNNNTNNNNNNKNNNNKQSSFVSLIMEEILCLIVKNSTNNLTKIACLIEKQKNIPLKEIVFIQITQILI